MDHVPTNDYTTAPFASTTTCGKNVASETPMTDPASPDPMKSPATGASAGRDPRPAARQWTQSADLQRQTPEAPQEKELRLLRLVHHCPPLPLLLLSLLPPLLTAFLHWIAPLLFSLHLYVCSCKQVYLEIPYNL